MATAGLSGAGKAPAVRSWDVNSCFLAHGHRHETSEAPWSNVAARLNQPQFEQAFDGSWKVAFEHSSNLCPPFYLEGTI